jgi:hypothetical protein
MPQGQQSGAAAAKWGLATGRKLAEQLGATLVSHRSNECLLRGERIVIKCAKQETDSVGVTFRMLERLSRVFGAFQQQDGSFDVWAVPASAFGQSMRDSQSGRQRGATPKVGLVRRSTFMDSGTHVGNFRLP